MDNLSTDCYLLGDNECVSEFNYPHGGFFSFKSCITAIIHNGPAKDTMVSLIKIKIIFGVFSIQGLWILLGGIAPEARRKGKTMPITKPHVTQIMIK